MSILRRKDNKFFNVEPELKKMYGKDYKLISEIAKNTQVIEDIKNLLIKLDKKLSKND